MNLKSIYTTSTSVLPLSISLANVSSYCTEVEIQTGIFRDFLQYAVVDNSFQHFG